MELGSANRPKNCKQIQKETSAVFEQTGNGMRACAGCKVGRWGGWLMCKLNAMWEEPRRTMDLAKPPPALPHLSSINLTRQISWQISWQIFVGVHVRGEGGKVLVVWQPQEFLIYSFNAAHCGLNGSSKVGERGHYCY